MNDYIPKDIDDCLTHLEKILTDSEKAIFKQCDEITFSLSMHFNCGLWIRNIWSLASGSRLFMYFNELGVHHPDSMSEIILTSYYRHLHGQEIKFEEQIKLLRDF